MRKASEQLRRGEVEEFDIFAKMASTRLRDQDRLDGASNYVIWKVKISYLLDEHDLKTYVNSVVVVLADADPLKKYKAEMAKTKRIILDGVRDQVVSHIADKDNSRQMWEALATLYEGSSKHRKVYLEERLRCMRKKKEDHVDAFLMKLQDVRDQLASIGSPP